MRSRSKLLIRTAATIKPAASLRISCDCSKIWRKRQGRSMNNCTNKRQLFFSSKFSASRLRFSLPNDAEAAMLGEVIDGTRYNAGYGELLGRSHIAADFWDRTAGACGQLAGDRSDRS